MRPRKKHRNLPARMYLKHGRYYYVRHNRWEPLSKDYTEALKQYAVRESAGGSGMVALFDRFTVEIARKKSANTFREYRRMAELLKPVFQEFSPKQVKPHHVAKVIDHEARKAPTQANRIRQYLSSVFSYAVRAGDVDSNPCRDVRGITVPKRDRYVTDEEFNAVKKAAPQSIADIMEFCYYTGQRIGDVIKVRVEDITSRGIYFEQGKTGKRLLVEMSDDLSGIAGRCGEKYLFESRLGGPYTYFGVSAMFRRACKAAGVEDFHIHDIRAKALTDAHKQGQDAQKLAGHKSRAMTDHYVKQRLVEAVKPPKRREN